MHTPHCFAALAGLLIIAGDAFSQSLNNPIDSNAGSNTYQGGLSAANWVNSFPDNSSVGPNDGLDFFATANGTNGDFPGLGITKDLGGTILNQPYAISLEVAYYGSGLLTPIPFSDFSTLRIGGASGNVTWINTPTPTAQYQWVQWSGVYTPAAGDLGNSFTFQAVFDERAGHSLAIDGPVTASPTPEPSALLLLTLGGVAFTAAARRRRTN